MFLQLSHTKLQAFLFSKELTIECYRITKLFPADERFAMISQIRRAALSVHLNIAEGCSRKTLAERKRFFEIARGSIIEIDTAIGIAHKLNYIPIEQLQPLGSMIIEAFKIVSGLIKTQLTTHY